ncbi:hypothetical protein N657DRAFT_648645, partial [Parathielavia appendiculata]
MHCRQVSAPRLLREVLAHSTTSKPASCTTFAFSRPWPHSQMKPCLRTEPTAQNANSPVYMITMISGLTSDQVMSELYVNEHLSNQKVVRSLSKLQTHLHLMLLSEEFHATILPEPANDTEHTKVVSLLRNDIDKLQMTITSHVWSQIRRAVTFDSISSVCSLLTFSSRHDLGLWVWAKAGLRIQNAEMVWCSYKNSTRKPKRDQQYRCKSLPRIDLARVDKPVSIYCFHT